MRRRYGVSPEQRQARASAAATTAQRVDRSLAERAWDNLRDGFARSGLGGLGRAADPGADGLFNPRDITRVREGSPVDWVLDRTVGEDREWFGSDQQRYNPAADVGRLATGRGMRGTPAAAREDARRDRYDQRAAADPIRNPADFSAFLVGQVIGGGISPENWVGGGSSFAGRSLVTRLASRASEQALVAGAVDLSLQASDVGAGVEERISVAQTLGAMGLGAALGATVDFVRSPPERRARVALEVGDELAAPTLSTRDIPATPPRPDPAPEPAPQKPQEAPRASSGPNPQEGPSSASSPPPESSAGVPEGWGGINWGSRDSNERIAAAERHLDALKRWIKPDEVRQFVAALRDGLPEAADGSRINPRWVDWETMGDPREVLGFTSALADIFRTTYDRAGAAPQNWEATTQAARQLGFTVSDLIKTHADVTGDGGLAARAGALRDAALASDKAFYDQLREMRTRLQRGDRSGLPSFVEALNRTVALGAMDAGASSEIARALQYRQRKPQALGGGDLTGALDELSRLLNRGQELDEAGLARMLDELSASYEKGGTVGLRQAVGQMRQLGLWDYVGYYATASLLSAPVTHIRNALGTPIHALFQIGERYVAAGIGELRVAAGLGSRERVTFREALAYTAGTFQAWGEALSLGTQAFRRGAPIVGTRSSVLADGASAAIPFALTPERIARWRQRPFSPATAADAFGVLVFELQRTLGFRPSVAMDEFYKALGRRMQVNALAYREAAYRAALADEAQRDAVFARTVEAIQEEPSEAAFRQAQAHFAASGGDPRAVHDAGSIDEEMALVLRAIDHRQMAADHAQLLAFQDAGPITEKLDAALRAVPLVKHLWVNFVRTPVALLRAGMVTRNPVIGGAVAGLELTTATGRQKHRALFDALLSEERALERGGAEADLVLARQLVGAAVLSTIWMFWANGDIVGKQSPEERRAGVLDYSMRLPSGQWVQFTGMSPLGEMLGLVADTGRALRDHDLEDDGAAALFGAVAAAVRNNIVNKSFLAGVGDFMELMTGGRYGAGSDEASGEQMGRQLAEAVIPRALPAGSLLRRAAQDQDPVVRDARSFVDMVVANVPLLSETVAARRDFLGRPLVRPEGQRGVLQAFNVSGPQSDPLDRELASLAGTLREGFRIGMSPRTLNGQSLSPEEYSHLVEVQGQLYRDPRTRRNMEEALRHLIVSSAYRELPAEGRAFEIKRTIERYREAANRAVRDPRSPHFMREAALRTGAERLRIEARRRGWSALEASARGQRYGLDPADPEVRALHEALFGEQAD